MTSLDLLNHKANQKVASSDAVASMIRADYLGLFRFAVLLTGNKSTAEDILAEALARTWQRNLRNPIRDPMTYLRRAIVNGAKRAGRRSHLERRVQTSVATQTASADPLSYETRAVLLQALLALPLSQRAVIVLRYLEDLPETEVAEVLAIPLGTVKSRSARGIAALRPLLRKGLEA